MTKLLLSIALLAAPIFAQSIPSGWKVIKDRTSACQIAVPADYQPEPAMPSAGKSPDGKIEAAILSSPAQVKPIMEAVGKAMGVDKFFENSATRVLYREKAVTTPDGKTLTGYKGRVPRPGGSCLVDITVSGGASDDVVTKIAGTAGPAK